MYAENVSFSLNALLLSYDPSFAFRMNKRAAIIALCASKQLVLRYLIRKEMKTDILRELKEELKEEEVAFWRLKRYYPPLASMKEKEIMSYLHLYERKELVAYVKRLLVVEEGQKAKRTQKGCCCLDAMGIPKNLYLDRSDALRVREMLEKEQGIALKIYTCPREQGWHLSKV